jgi:hypothetical protein
MTSGGLVRNDDDAENHPTFPRKRIEDSDRHHDLW